MSRPESTSGAPALDPGSFRDWDSRVFYDNGRVLRVLSEDGLDGWVALSESKLFGQAVDQGLLIPTSRVDDAAVPEALVGDAAAVLEHERIPFVSYPYEWPFSMLKDAALLQLDLLDRALAEDLILKDSTPYNVQFRGAKPVFIDVGSFERLPAGEPWSGYRQFCMLFLYPLLLQAYKGIAFQPWLRGRLAGITPAEARAVMSVRDLFRRGVPTHVALHARLERKNADTTRDVKGEMKKAGFKKQYIAANVNGLAKLVRRLDWEPGKTEWNQYGFTTSYTDEDATRKEAFVREVVHSRRWRLTWDIGCNRGNHARIAGENSDYVIAVDGDAAVIDGLYRSLKDDGTTTILPLVGDLTDPSPALGWGGRERSPLEERGKPELVLCLAVIHHVVMSGNVPVAEFLTWVQSLGCALVIEFPTRDDPRVAALLARKKDGAHPDYDRGPFERELAARFRIERTEELAGGTRVMYHAVPN